MKGIYTIRKYECSDESLICEDNLIEEITQENDLIINGFIIGLYLPASDYRVYTGSTRTIFLSEYNSRNQTFMPRDYVAGNTLITNTYISGVDGNSYGYYETKWRFNAPASTKTWRSAALSQGTYQSVSHEHTLQSIVNFNTPITQTSTQILEITYRLYLDYQTEFNSSEYFNIEKIIKPMQKRVAGATYLGLNNSAYETPNPYPLPNRFSLYECSGIPPLKYVWGTVLNYQVENVSVPATTESFSGLAKFHAYGTLTYALADSVGKLFRATAWSGFNGNIQNSPRYFLNSNQSVNVPLQDFTPLRKRSDGSSNGQTVIQNTYSKTKGKYPYLDIDTQGAHAGSITVSDTNTTTTESWNVVDPGLAHLYKIKITQTGTVSAQTASYKISKRRLTSTLGNSWVSTPIGLPHMKTQGVSAANNTPYEKSLIVPSLDERRHGQEMFPRTAGQANYGNNIKNYGRYGNPFLQSYVYPEFLSIDETGITINDINSNFQNLDANSTPSLTVTGINQVATKDDGTIFVACSNTGLYKITKTTGNAASNCTVTKITPVGVANSTICQGVCIKESSNDVYALFNTELAKSTDNGNTWSLLSNFSIPNLDSANAKNVLAITIDPNHADNRFAITFPATVNDYTGPSRHYWWSEGGSSARYAYKITTQSRFNESVGTSSFTDLAGRTFSANGGLTITASGKFSNCVYFNANTKYLQSDYSYDNELGGGDYSISGWIKLDANTSGHLKYIADFRDSSHLNELVLYVNGPTLRVNVDTSDVITSNNISTGTWNHFAIQRTCNTISSNAEVKLYINGTQSGSTYTYSIPAVSAYLASKQYIIGQNYTKNAILSSGFSISDFVITKSGTIFSSNFVAPTEEFSTTVPTISNSSDAKYFDPSDNINQKIQSTKMLYCSSDGTWLFKDCRSDTNWLAAVTGDTKKLIFGEYLCQRYGNYGDFKSNFLSTGWGFNPIKLPSGEKYHTALEVNRSAVSTTYLSSYNPYARFYLVPDNTAYMSGLSDYTFNEINPTDTIGRTGFGILYGNYTSNSYRGDWWNRQSDFWMQYINTGLFSGDIPNVGGICNPVGGMMCYVGKGIYITYGATNIYYDNAYAGQFLVAHLAPDSLHATTANGNNIPLVVNSYVATGNADVVCNTITTSGLYQNNTIFISGASGTEESKLNGTWKIKSILSGNSFSFTVGSSVSSGTYTTNIGSIIRRDLDFDMEDASPNGLMWEKYGWDGSAWVLGHEGSKSVHSAYQNIIDGLKIKFNPNTIGATNDFIAGDFFYSYAYDGVLNDNATTVTIASQKPVLPSKSGTTFSDSTVPSYKQLTNFKFNFGPDCISASTNYSLNILKYYTAPGKLLIGDRVSSSTLVNYHKLPYKLSGDFTLTFKCYPYYSSTTRFCGIFIDTWTNLKSHGVNDTATTANTGGNLNTLHKYYFNAFATAPDLNQNYNNANVVYSVASSGAAFSNTAVTNHSKDDVFVLSRVGSTVSITRNGNPLHTYTTGDAGGDLGIAIMQSNDSQLAVYDGTLTANITEPVIYIGDIVNQTGPLYDSNYWCLFPSNWAGNSPNPAFSVYLDEVPAQILYDGYIDPAKNQVQITPDGLIRCNVENVGNTITGKWEYLTLLVD